MSVTVRDLALSLAISAINSWNRLAVGFGAQPAK
jgi:hypothetical protein